MDFRTFSKPKMWANVAGGIICFIMFAYELYSRLINDSSIISSLLFLFLAVNCTFRVFSYAKLNSIKKRMANDSQFVKEERRQSIIINIFSNATAVLCLLVFLIHHITIKGTSVAFDAFLGICAICFSVILVQSIQNLKRFDRL